MSRPNDKLPSTTSFSAFRLPALEFQQASLTAGTSIPAPPPSPPLRTTSKSRPGPIKIARSRDGTQNGTAMDIDDEDYSGGRSPKNTESPNPLRSHPTSSHSLSKPFDGTATPGTPQSGVEFGKHSLTSAHKRGTGDSSLPQSPGTATTCSGPPPSKRPLSVRKLLSLRALNSPKKRDSEDGNSNDPMLGKSGRNRAQSIDNLSAFSFGRPESALSSHGGEGRKNSFSGSLRRRSSAFFFGRKIKDLGDVKEDKEAEREKERAPMLPEIKNEDAKDGKTKGEWFGGDDMFQDIK